MKEYLEILINGLFYGGDLSLSVVNYFLVLITLIPFLLTKLKKINRWKIILVVSALVQATFWFVLYAQGVSIIWNCMLGVFLGAYFQNKSGFINREKYLIYSSILLAVFGDIYYGIIFPMITTIAHLSALVMGLVLYFVLSKKKIDSV